MKAGGRSAAARIVEPDQDAYAGSPGAAGRVVAGGQVDIAVGRHPLEGLAEQRVESEVELVAVAERVGLARIQLLQHEQPLRPDPLPPLLEQLLE